MIIEMVEVAAKWEVLVDVDLPRRMGVIGEKQGMKSDAPILLDYEDDVADDGV